LKEEINIKDKYATLQMTGTMIKRLNGQTLCMLGGMANSGTPKYFKIYP
jgi:hypothetical protein